MKFQFNEKAKRFLKSEKTLKRRSDLITLLEHYSRWLEQHGYLDTDWRTEAPFAIDEYLKSSQKDITS